MVRNTFVYERVEFYRSSEKWWKDSLGENDRIRCQICFTGVNSVILEKKKETRIGTMQLSGQLLRVERWTPIKWRPLKSFQFGPRDGTVIALR